MSELFRYSIKNDDIDSSGILNFARYASLFEIACLHFLEQVDVNVMHLHMTDIDLRIRTIKINYLKPAVLEDNVLFECVLKHVGPARLKMEGHMYKFINTVKIMLARGEFEFVFVDKIKGIPVLIPDETKTKLIKSINYD